MAGEDAGQAIAAGDEARDARAWPDAASHYRRALDLRPELAPIWVQYGHALKESGRVSDAEMAYRQAIEIDAMNPDTHVQLGHALKLRGQTDEAMESYVRALRLDAGFAPAQEELAGLGLPTASIRQLLRRMDGRFGQQEPRRVVFCFEGTFQALPLEIRSLMPPEGGQGPSSMGFARFEASTMSWRSAVDGVPFSFEGRDVVISIAPASPTLLRSIRSLQRNGGVLFAPIVVNLGIDAPEAGADAESLELWQLRWLDTIDHAAVVLCPGASAAREVGETLRRWGRASVPVCRVALDSLPAWATASESAGSSAGASPYVVADLRNARAADADVVAEAWKGLTSGGLAPAGTRLMVLASESVAALEGLRDVEEVVDLDEPGQARLVRGAHCVVVPHGQEGWPSMVRLALAQGTVPVVGPDPELREAAGGLGEICLTMSATELVRRTSRVLMDEKYRRGRRAIIGNRNSARDAAEVVRDLASAIAQGVQAAAHDPGRRISEDGTAAILLDVPYTLGLRPGTLRGLPLGRAGNFLADGDWLDWHGKAVVLRAGAADLRFSYMADSLEPLTISLLVALGPGTIVRVGSPQGSGPDVQVSAEGPQWIDLSVWPQADNGLVQIRFDCKARSADGRCVVHLLYAVSGRGEKVSRRFLEMLQTTALVQADA